MASSWSFLALTFRVRRGRCRWSAFLASVSGVLDRLTRDDGRIDAADIRDFEIWNKMKMRSIADQLRSEGATECDLATWRAAFRNEIALRVNEGEARVF